QHVRQQWNCRGKFVGEHRGRLASSPPFAARGRDPRTRRHDSDRSRWVGRNLAPSRRAVGLRAPRRRPGGHWRGTAVGAVGFRESVMGLPDPDRTRVVLIGADEYRNFPGLPAVRNNLARLAELFTAPHAGGLPAGHCVTVRNPADRDDVLDAVCRAASEATDTLVVYFAGHGMRSPDGSLYLALGHSEQGRRFYKSVAFSDLRTEVLEGAAPRKVVILDCCYSGAALEGYMG